MIDVSYLTSDLPCVIIMVSISATSNRRRFYYANSQSIWILTGEQLTCVGCFFVGKVTAWPGTRTMTWQGTRHGELRSFGELAGCARSANDMDGSAGMVFRYRQQLRITSSTGTSIRSLRLTLTTDERSAQNATTESTQKRADTGGKTQSKPGQKERRLYAMDA